MHDSAHHHDAAGHDPATMGLAQLVMQLAGCIRSARLSALEPFGLALHQARAFTVIARYDQGARSARIGRGEPERVSGDLTELRPSDLARRLRIAPRSATEVIDALEEKGLVQRTASTTDRRATHVSLTDEGRSLYGQLRESSSADDGIFESLEPAELDTLTQLLRKAAAAHPEAATHRR